MVLFFSALRKIKLFFENSYSLTAAIIHPRLIIQNTWLALEQVLYSTFFFSQNEHCIFSHWNMIYTDILYVLMHIKMFFILIHKYTFEFSWPFVENVTDIDHYQFGSISISTIHMMSVIQSKCIITHYLEI